MRKVEHGFDLAAIRRDLNREDWQEDLDNPGTEVRRLFLGSFQSLTPSGKFYLPFACSNVAGDCPVCHGKCEVEPRTGRRIRKRAKRRQHELTRGVIKRGSLFSPAGKAYADRVQRFRDGAFRRTNLTCQACDGLGSISAARDERWHEAVEKAFEGTDFYLDCSDGDYFAAESRDAQEELEDHGS